MTPLSMEDRKTDSARRADRNESSHSLSSKRFGGQRVEPISSENYYSHNAEFRTWLLERRQLTLNMIPSSLARQHFESFVKRWNSGKLDDALYRSSASSDRQPVAIYDWGIHKEDRGTTPHRPRIHSERHTQREQVSREDRRESERDADRIRRRHVREQHALTMETLAPRPEGHAALREKRALKGAYAHRDKDMDVEWDDRTMIGDTSSELKAAMARDAQRKQRQQDRQATHSAEMDTKVRQQQQKEDATMAMLRQLARQKYTVD